MPKRPRNRKRPPAKGAQRQTFADKLGRVGKLIAKNKPANALQALNALAAAEGQSPQKRSRLTAATGDYLLSLSRYEEASVAFQQAALYGQNSQAPALVLRAMMGQAGALLLAGQAEEAKAVTTKLLALIRDANASLDSLSDLSPADLQQSGPITVGPRPPRLSVVITRLAGLFQRHGDTELAQLLFAQAVRLSPNGASRARQGIAKLSLAGDNPEHAERLARDSLQMGKYQAKTVAAWPLLLTARARQNKTPLLEPDLYDALLTHAGKGVLGRSILQIVITLRAFGSADWRTIAQAYLTRNDKRDDVIATEISKILHSQSKIETTQGPGILAQQAWDLFHAKDAGPNEMVAHAKSYVRNRLLAAQDVDLAKLTRQAQKRHGDDTAFQVRHAAALGAMLAKRHDLARDWLKDHIKKVPSGSNHQGKALWALARMETVLGNFADSARNYFAVANQEANPARFRIQAMLKGFDQSAKGGEQLSAEELKPQVTALIESTDDFRILLDAGRQLGFAGPAFAELKTLVRERGKTLADLEFARATSPAQQLATLEYLSRRLYYDLQDSAGVIDRWNALTEEKRILFKLAGGSTYYEYVAVVMHSLHRKGRDNDLRQIASSIIDENQSTSEGYVIVGTAYAHCLLSDRKIDDALNQFRWISQECPAHRVTAHAHYWIMIDHWKNSRFSEAVQSGLNVRSCFCGLPSLKIERELDARSIILLNQLSSVSIVNPYEPDFIQSQNTALNISLSWLNI